MPQLVFLLFEKIKLKIHIFIYLFLPVLLSCALPQIQYTPSMLDVYEQCVCTLFDRVFVCLFNECTMHVLRVWINGDANIFIRTTTTDSRRKSPIRIQSFGEYYSSASNRRNSAMIEMSKCMGAHEFEYFVSFLFLSKFTHMCVCDCFGCEQGTLNWNHVNSFLMSLHVFSDFEWRITAWKEIETRPTRGIAIYIDND